MPIDITKRLPVTFSNSMPLGTHASFKHDGKMWIAYPATKNARIWTIIDRMLGINNRIETEMIQWISQWPEDAKKVAAVLNHLGRSRVLGIEIATEKIGAGKE